MTDPDPEGLFGARYGYAPAIRSAAPGRVNLLGEHTDYNEGFVLPVATPQCTEVLLAARSDAQVRVWSAAVGAQASYCIGQERRAGTWLDYVAGVTASLQELGRSFRGFDASIASTVPLGAGLSSSASLQVALLRGLNALFTLHLEPSEIAMIAHRSESQFVGVPVGIMDQMAVSLGDSDSALFLDTQSLDFERVPLPRGTALIVIDSGLPHDHASNEYRVRRRECEQAAGLLGIPSLRALTRDALDSGRLPETLQRRARHVFTENDRVLRAVAALRIGDARAAGALMNASHASLRDDYEVSLPAIDRLVSLAQTDTDVFGARLTGGGFGGAIVALANATNARQAGERIAAAYAAESRQTPTLLLPRSRNS